MPLSRNLILFHRLIIISSLGSTLDSLIKLPDEAREQNDQVCRDRHQQSDGKRVAWSVHFLITLGPLVDVDHVADDKDQEEPVNEEAQSLKQALVVFE